MNASGRRCRQFANGFAHISGKRRPRYKVPASIATQRAERSKRKGKA